MKTFVLLLACCAPALAQQTVSMRDPRWQFHAADARIETYNGTEALFLRSGDAWLQGVAIENGVVEFDVAAPANPGFHGLAFRAADENNYEHIYLRSHLSNQPDAVQYTPVFNAVSGWQIYSDRRYVRTTTIKPDAWVHVRIAFHAGRAELDVDGKRMVFPELVRAPQRGGLGLTSEIGPAWFANFKYSEGVTEIAPDSVFNAPRPPSGLITEWNVSAPFREGVLPTRPQWKKLTVESNGIANLARLSPVDTINNTVIAATQITGDGNNSVRVRFGFSDRVQIVFNGRPIYRGHDEFVSRDYRFLGTVGFFDEIELPLRKGVNDLWFAVTERFGGWAVVATVERFVPPRL